jgi:hypothetical protein
MKTVARPKKSTKKPAARARRSPRKTAPARGGKPKTAVPPMTEAEHQLKAAAYEHHIRQTDVKAKTATNEAPPEAEDDDDTDVETTISRIAAETDALRFRTTQIGGNGGGGYSGDASIGDIVRATFDGGGRAYNGDQDEPRVFLRDALLSLSDDLEVFQAALSNHGGGMEDVIGRCMYRAEHRARMAVELDHRLELGLEREAAKGQVQP